MEIPVRSGSRYLHYRLTVKNGDNAPITVLGIKGKGPCHEALFFHRGKNKLYLCYGAQEAESPAYDVGAVLRKAPVASGVLWVLGGEETKDIQKQTTTFPDLKYVLMIVLSLMVVVLVIVLIIAVRRVDENTERRP